MSSPALGGGPFPVVVPLFRITGLCGAGRHDFCQNRVYIGHDGERSVYVPCDCECHEEAKAA